MKKGFLTLMLLALCGLTFAQLQSMPQWTRVLSDQPESFRTQLISSSENSIKVNIQVPGFYTTNVTTPRGEAKVITMPKTVSTAKAGEPNVPMTGIPAIIGDQARMNIRVLDAQYMDFEDFEVAPSKGDFSRQIDPATVPYTYGECYSQDAFFPASNVGLYEPYIIRDFRGQNMVVYPYAYNPVSKTLRVYYNMTVELFKVDNNGSNVMETRRSNTIKMDPDFKSVYQRHFINYQAAMNRYTPVDEEGDLLIICYDNFISSMTDFVNWKKTRGVNTTIVGTSTAGSTYSAIKTYIQSQYNANNNLTHVLLVGDVAQISGYTYTGASGYEGKGDNPYGQVVGNDIYNDLFIGRFSASNTDHVATQVQKVITYERDLTTSDTWCQNGLGVSTTAGSGGHYNEDDYQHIENLRTDLFNYGYSTVYQDYYNVSGYPSSSTTTISNHINSGVGVINYCNHGSQTAWQSHNYTNSHVNALTNNNKLPFIFSVACLNGKYDYSGDCFAEAWMRATNGSIPTGAVGGAFSYISQPWIPPMWAQDEFVDILVESYSNNIKRTLGGAMVNGMMAIFDNYSTSDAPAVGTYQAWITYGDPTLMLRTKTPQAMTVTHNGNITIGTSSYMVNVSNGNGAVATITDANHNIWGKATVSNNTATINLNSSNLTPDSELTLCVFGFDKVTYLGTINVVGGTQYDITVNQPQHGSISAPAQAYANSMVTLTATPDEGYTFGSWVVYKTGDANTTVTVNGDSFTMPNYPVTISANFVLGPTDLTVYDGTVTNQYIPMYGFYFDDYTKSECIIPATALTTMTGCTISAITFYPATVSTRNWNGSEQTVFLKEVSGTTLGGSYSGTSGATTVKVGSPLEMPTAGTAYTITFDTPYTYNGGNLLIGVYNDDGSGYNDVAWYGTDNLTSGVSAYGSNGSSLNSVGFNAQAFLPKTTFTYLPAASNEPVEITASVNPANAGTVTGAGTYDPGTTVTLTATANEGYTFTNWTKNGVVMSTNATYSFTVSAAAAYVANFTINSYTVTATTNPTDGGTVTVGSRNRDDLLFDFEDGTQDWTTLKGNTGDSPNNWHHNTTHVSYSNGTAHDWSSFGHNNSSGFMMSESYISATSSSGTPYGAVTPDNYLVSPQVRLGGSISFYAGARNTSYCAEKFSVMVSTTDNTNTDSFTTVATWTLSLSQAGYTSSPYTVDLSEYSGMGYIAIRHWDCYDQWVLCIDDITIVEGVNQSTASGNFNYGESCTLTATPNEGYNFVNWTKDGNTVSTNATYSFTVTETATYVANFAEAASTVTQSSQFIAGWNWWTPNVELTLEQLETALGSNGLTIIDQSGATVSNHPVSGWGGDNIVIEMGKMYKIEMSTACTVILEGNAANPTDHSITLTPGTNWLGFFGSQSMSVSDALTNLSATTGDVITSQDGSSATYHATYGWGGDLTTLVSGQAYLYISNASSIKTFTFPASK